MKQLTQSEKLFCYYYSNLQNAKEAAIKSGYKPISAEASAAKLLERPEITAQINKLCEQKAGGKLISSIVSGLNRLAFNSSTDSLRLALCDRDFLASHLDELDLFHISELKIPKDGAIEIKFFDRFKAFDKLLEIARYSLCQNEAAEFFTALEQSAIGISEEDNSEI